MHLTYVPLRSSLYYYDGRLYIYRLYGCYSFHRGYPCVFVIAFPFKICAHYFIVFFFSRKATKAYNGQHWGSQEKQQTNHMLNCTVHNPLRSEHMGESYAKNVYKNIILHVPRKVAIKLVRVYRTTSIPALLVLARTAPINLLVGETTKIENKDKQRSGQKRTKKRVAENVEKRLRHG